MFRIPLRICWFPKFSNWASKRQQKHTSYIDTFDTPKCLIWIWTGTHTHMYKNVTSWSCTQQTTNSECAFRCLNNWAFVDGPILHRLGCFLEPVDNWINNQSTGAGVQDFWIFLRLTVSFPIGCRFFPWEYVSCSVPSCAFAGDLSETETCSRQCEARHDVSTFFNAAWPS